MQGRKLCVPACDGRDGTVRRTDPFPFEVSVQLLGNRAVSQLICTRFQAALKFDAGKRSFFAEIRRCNGYDDRTVCICAVPFIIAHPVDGKAFVFG